MAQDQRQANGLTVVRYGITGTDLTVYTVWEPYAQHGTSYRLDEANVGRVGTRRLPADLEALTAYSSERSKAVGAWYAAQYDEAYAAIVTAFPEAADGRRDMGEITVS